MTMKHALLLRAVRNGRTIMARLSIAMGADANTVIEKGITVLHQAAYFGNISMLKLLLAKGADPNAADNGGDTPLYWAAAYAPAQKKERAVRLLIDKGADVAAISHDKAIVLRCVCPETVMHILEQNGMVTGPEDGPADRAPEEAQAFSSDEAAPPEEAGVAAKQPAPKVDRAALEAVARGLQLSDSDPDGAIEAFSEAIRLCPHYAFAYVNRGHAHFLKGRLKAALEDFTEVIRLEPENATGYGLRASIYRALGETRKAEADRAKQDQLKKG